MTQALENTPSLWRMQIPRLATGGHKYQRGQVLVRGGAVLTGAARLAARAAQRIGAGLVTIVAPTQAWPIYAAALESIMVRPCDTAEDWQVLLDQLKPAALVIGPGLGVSDVAREETLEVVAARKPVVLDADVSSNFAHDPRDLFANLHPYCVLTPHEGEFARLFGAVVDMNLDRLTRAVAASRLCGAVIVLKGHETIIATPDAQPILNRHAPPTLATAGSGDVLAGLIAGLIAQGMEPRLAAACAVWMHGDAAYRFGPGLIAEDIIAKIPEVLGGLAAL